MFHMALIQSVMLATSLMLPISKVSAITSGFPLQLVDLSTIDPSIKIDLRYAGINNFLRRKLYPDEVCYLHQDTVVSLKKAQQAFKELGYGLKIWDGYRPLSVQWKFWEACSDERYVANPAKGGGRHTRGTAVDVTLIDLKTDTELEMPTTFDDFSPKAWSNSHDCSDIAKSNRTLLHKIMRNNGFQSIKTEWWHFDLKGWKNYPVL